MSLKPKNAQLQLIALDLFGREHAVGTHHAVIRVTLRSGKSYALDITGAHYGHYEPVVPWDSYMDLRVQQIAHSSKFGGWQSLLYGKVWGSETTEYGIRELYKAFTLQLNAAMADWQNDNLALSAMLKSPKDAFKRKQSEFIKFIESRFPTPKELKKWEEDLPVRYDKPR